MAVEYDVVVVGAGAGGLTAALVAALEGRRVLLLERSAQVGGTTARSSGTVWVPGNPDQERRLGVHGDVDAARAYLRALAGDRASPELIEAFLAGGRAMVAYLERRVGLAFRAYDLQPDYRQDLPGATTAGRALEPPAFDGRRLAERFSEVRSPLPELMLFARLGGMMVTRGEVARLLGLGRSWDSLRLGTAVTGRFARDRLRFHRGTRLVLGNALVARLYHEFLVRGGSVWLNATPRSLVKRDRRVAGVVVGRPSGEDQLVRAGAVVLAGGGFPGSAPMRAAHLPEPTPAHTAAFEGADGSALRLALDAGGRLGPPGIDNAYWFPSSLARRRDGTTAVYPHIVLDRAKPGLIAVDRGGRRFVNEACSYHDFVRGIYAANRSVPSIPAALICDRAFVWRYGLGLIRPLTPSLRRFVREGYLRVDDTLAGLAAQLGIPGDALSETVRAHNRYAETGADLDFGKGASAYDRANGDPGNVPNPCLGAIARPPYCAVLVWPTPLATSLGVLCGPAGEVLDGAGEPIPGLYACGNDMHTVTGGEYPGPGAQIGVAMTFGFLAAQHAAGNHA